MPAPRPRAPVAEWHGSRLAAFLQDGGRVAVLVCASSAGRAAVLRVALPLMPGAVIRAGNPLASPLTLYRLLIQVGAEDDGGDEAESLLRCLAGHAAGPEPVVLLVDDAHTLSNDVLLALTRVPHLAPPGQPGVALVLAGGPALPDMLSAPGLDSLRDPSTMLSLVVPADGFEMGPDSEEAGLPGSGKPGAGLAAPAVPPPPVPMAPLRAGLVVHAPMDRAGPAVPMPPVRPAQVFQAPMDSSIVQIPMPMGPSAAVPSIRPKQALAAPAAPGPSPAPAVRAAPSRIWARPPGGAPPFDAMELQHQPYLARLAALDATEGGDLSKTPPTRAPPSSGGAPVRAAELVAEPTPIESHITDVRSIIGVATVVQARRRWLALAATGVAVAAAGGALVVLRIRLPAPAPATAPATPEPPTPPRPQPMPARAPAAAPAPIEPAPPEQLPAPPVPPMTPPPAPTAREQVPAAKAPAPPPPPPPASKPATRGGTPVPAARPPPRPERPALRDGGNLY